MEHMCGCRELAGISLNIYNQMFQNSNTCLKLYNWGCREKIMAFRFFFFFFFFFFFIVPYMAFCVSILSVYILYVQNNRVQIDLPGQGGGVPLCPHSPPPPLPMIWCSTVSPINVQLGISTVKGYFSGMSGNFMFPMCITPPPPPNTTQSFRTL